MEHLIVKNIKANKMELVPGLSGTNGSFIGDGEYITDIPKKYGTLKSLTIGDGLLSNNGQVITSGDVDISIDNNIVVRNNISEQTINSTLIFEDNVTVKGVTDINNLLKFGINKSIKIDASIDMNNRSISNLGVIDILNYSKYDAISNNDLNIQHTKAFNFLNNVFPQTNKVLSGDINLNGNRIINVGLPVNSNDMVNKIYFDNILWLGGDGIEITNNKIGLKLDDTKSGLRIVNNKLECTNDFSKNGPLNIKPFYGFNLPKIGNYTICYLNDAIYDSGIFDVNKIRFNVYSKTFLYSSNNKWYDSRTNLYPEYGLLPDTNFNIGISNITDDMYYTNNENISFTLDGATINNEIIIKINFL